jgi:tripartite-type tricarboxylate transporter receptor subunit TctC
MIRSPATRDRDNEPVREEAMRRFLYATAAAAMALAVCAPEAAQAQDYPTKPVRIVVGFGAGSVADIVARVMAARMGQTLGQQFIVENRTGAGSNIAAEFVSRAPKDGYTMFMATVANSINPALGPMNFDFGKDLAPVVLVANVPQMLVVHPSLGVSSIKELIALAKSKPESIQYASSGIGTLSHLSAELLNHTAGIKLQQVPYPGSAQALNDVIAGRVPLMFGPASTTWGAVKAGKLKALSVTETKRTAMAPDVPTMSEAGVPGYAAGIWMGMLVPAGTPQPVVDKLSEAANEALKSGDVQKSMSNQGVDALGGSPADFARHIDGELKKWAGLVKAAGIKRK